MVKSFDTMLSLLKLKLVLLTIVFATHVEASDSDSEELFRHRGKSRLRGYTSTSPPPYVPPLPKEDRLTEQEGIDKAEEQLALLQEEIRRETKHKKNGVLEKLEEECNKNSFTDLAVGTRLTITPPWHGEEVYAYYLKTDPKGILIQPECRKLTPLLEFKTWKTFYTKNEEYLLPNSDCKLIGKKEQYTKEYPLHHIQDKLSNTCSEGLKDMLVLNNESDLGKIVDCHKNKNGIIYDVWFHKEGQKRAMSGHDLWTVTHPSDH